jgi:lipoprotein-releasing system ATP-binding protein
MDFLAREITKIGADEPMGNLDRKNADEVLELLLETRKNIGLTRVMVTHDMKIANRADKGYIMGNGNLLSRNIDFDNV